MKAILSAVLSFLLAFTSFFGLTGKTETTEAPDAFYDANESVSVIVELEGAGLLDGINGSEERKALVDTIEQNDAYVKLQQAQQALKEKIQNKFSAADFSESYSYSFIANGFSLDIPYRYVDDLRELPGVKSVTISATFSQPETVLPLDLPTGTKNPSDYFTGILDMHEQGFTGKGTVLAVLDTGFDVGHEAFDFDVADPTYTKKDIQLKSAFGFLNTIVPRFSAHYYSQKIPYKWDYAKMDKDVYNAANGHGTHVAGIAAGRGEGFTGMAPDAQLLLMKVFKDGSNGVAKQVHILAALDDCVKLNADVINLSLGSEGGQAPEEIFSAFVVNRLKRAGINVVSSAGNAASMGSYDRVYGDAMNIDLFDYGTTNSPASYEPFMSVASAQIYSGWSLFTPDTISIYGKGSVKMSTFSAWGPTCDLRLKPEITAPGTSIYSSINDNQYGYMSGTSMASPCFAGAIAVMRQYLRDQRTDLNEKDAAEFINDLMMSTATVFRESGGKTFVSPRRQGAGFMNLNAAVQTPAYLTQSDGKSRPKIDLGENHDGVLQFSFKLQNISDQTLTYAVSENVMTDEYAKRGEKYVNLTTSIALPQSAYTVEYLAGITDGLVTVAPGCTTEISMRITLSDAMREEYESVFTNGYYVDGFVWLNDAEGDAPTLSIPYMTFCGDWNRFMLFDYTIYDETPPYLNGDWGLAVTDGDEYYPLGMNLFEHTDETNIDTKYCAYSKNALGMKKPYVTVSIGLLRNAKRMDFNLFTDSGLFRYCGSTLLEYCRKTSCSGKETHGVLWGGKSGLINHHGYVYKVSTRAENYKTARTTIEFPFVVDNDAPKVDAVTYHNSPDGNVLDVVISDQHYVMGYELLTENDVHICDVSFKGIEPENGVYHSAINVSDMASWRITAKQLENVKLRVVDYAYNETYVSLQLNSSESQLSTADPNAVLQPRAYVFNAESVSVDNTPAQTVEKTGLAALLEKLQNGR